MFHTPLEPSRSRINNEGVHSFDARATATKTMPDAAVRSRSKVTIECSFHEINFSLVSRVSVSFCMIVLRSWYDIIEASSYAFELSLSLTYLPRARPGQPAQSLSPAPGPCARWLHPSVRSPCIYPVMQPPCPALSMLCRARASSCAINATVCDFRSIDLSLPPPTPPHLSALSSPPPSWPAPPRVPSSFALPFAQALCLLLQPSLPLPACCQPAAAALAPSTPRLFSC